MNVIKAFILRDLSIERSYRFHCIVKTVNIIFQLAIFYFLGTLIPDMRYFSFVLIGLMFSRFFQFWLSAFTNNIRQEQYWGTAELVFLSPAAPLKVLFASVSGKFLLMLLELVVFAVIGKLLFKAELFMNINGFLPILAIHSMSFSGLGLLSGSFIMYYKKGDPVNWLVGVFIDLFSGVYFPLSVLPLYAQKASGFLPTTSALHAWRNVLLENQPLLPRALAVEFLWAVFFIGCGVVSFRYAFSLAQKRGELGNY